MSTSKGRILLVEDEKALRDNLKLNLEMEGYDVVTAEKGNDAIHTFQNEHFDLVILDIMLPVLDGYTVAESIRTDNDNTPIIFLSAKNTTQDKIQGLKKGADDYMVKPFELEELLLRVKLLREKSDLLNSNVTSLSDEFSFGENTVVFPAQKAINYEGNEINLSRTETKLLKLLIENESQVVSREHILQVVWGYEVYPNTRTIDNFILKFRKNFEPDSKSPIYFHSVRGVGYRFTA